VFVRPHDLSLKKHREDPNAIEGRVTHIRTTGLSVRVSLALEGGSQLQIELPAEEFQKLSLEKGEVAFATPREVKVFGGNYSI
jgi:ABC-type sulfate/molybdate transport systems ATPase subunit